MRNNSSLSFRTVGGILTLALAYFAAGWLGLMLSTVGENITLIWPPTGIALAALLRFGVRLWPGVLLGALAVDATTSAPLVSMVGIALGNTVEAVAAYWLLVRLAPIDLSLPRLRDAVRLILLGGGVASMVSASVGVASLMLGGVIQPGHAASAWSVWWMGDAMGAIVFGPTLLAWAHRRTARAMHVWWLEMAVYAVVTLVTALVSVSGLGPFSGNSLPLAYLAVPILIWGGARFGLRGVTFCVLAFTFAALLGVLNGHGLFKRATTSESLTVLWLYANTLAMSGLILAAYVRQLSEAQAELRLAGTVFERLPIGVVIADAQGMAIAANPSYFRITGFSPADILGQGMRRFAASRHGAEEVDRIRETAATKGEWSGELWTQCKDGKVIPTATSVTVARDWDGEITHFIAAITDITERKAIEARNRELAEHDVLTGLPNRMLLTDRLQQAIHHANRRQCRMAVLFVDLDRFKVINDSLGHDVGDEMLQVLAKRLSACVREDDTVARQGGDEFVMIVEEVMHDADVAQVAQKMLDAVAQPCEVRGYTLNVTASIGIALYPRDGQDPATLLKHADLAMYHGKEGRAAYHFYGEDMERLVQARLAIEGRLRRALEQNELILHYQPQVDTRTGAIVGVEALLRWQPTEGGMVPPGDFIGIAEETGLILPIGRWVLHEAVAQVARWQSDGIAVPRIAINVSARQLWHGGLGNEVQRAIEESGIAPQLLEIELTESVFLRSTDDVHATLTQLDGLGVRIAIDDFGTGYSSLGYLRRLPVDTLKLDRSFVQDLPNSMEAGAITSAVISLASGLGISVVAEGVETEAQYAYLSAQLCPQLQGFYFSKPLPADACAEVLRKGNLRER